MADHSIYRDIAERTGGDIYIGVVGPVRTGKSTFIKRFMESLVLPHITEGYSRERARDEMPQSAAGKTVMTTEPKFIPDEAVNIRVGESGTMRVKMIDCVGYLVDGALGTVEEDHPRMVRTPWSDSPMPFAEAAEMGTHKVITEHATIGMLITTDGSVGELPRSAYVEAEERVVSELRALGKPFAMILNSARPSSQEAIALAYELEAKYSVPVALVSCMDLDAEDIRHILELVLHEFPVAEVRVSLPEWTTALEPTHRVHKAVMEALGHAASRVKRIGDIRDAFADISDGEYVTAATVDEVDLGRGAAKVSLTMADGLYYRILSELSGFEITGEQSLISLLRELSETKAAYDKIAEALRDCDERGYGIVMPDVSDMTLDEPEIVRQSGGYGVRLRASASSVHMIKANIEAEVSPIVGTEQQSEDLVRYMLKEFDEDPTKIWESNMFGKSLYELVNEGIHAKLEHMPEASRQKLSETLERIINEGSGGLICILL